MPIQEIQDCESTWKPETTCSKSCEGGVRTMKRVILQSAKNGGHDCAKNNIKTKPCNENIPCSIAMEQGVFSFFGKYQSLIYRKVESSS